MPAIITMQKPINRASYSAAVGGGGAVSPVFRDLVTGKLGDWTDNSSGNSHGTWTTDGTYNFFRVDYSGNNPDSGINHYLAESNIREIRISYWRRHNGSTTKGPKDCKIFGFDIGATSYGSNLTLIAPSYGNGLCVDYGDDVGQDNNITVFFGDTTSTFPGHGSSPSSGRSSPKPTVVTSGGDVSDITNSWQQQFIHLKKNSEGTQDGIIEFWRRLGGDPITGGGTFHCDLLMTGVWNNPNYDAAHPNATYIENIGIGQYMNTGLAGVSRDYYDFQYAYTGWPTQVPS